MTTLAPETLAPTPSANERTQRRRTLIGTGIGNALEWYDWNVYAAFTVFLAAQLFDNSDPASAVLSTLAIFAVGFVARPFGGFLFGWIADRKGRKFSLMLAVSLASAGSLLIALTPTFGTVGVLSSVMLVVARLIQGLAHGGELPSAQTYLSEMAPRKKRGLWSSWIYISGTCGVLLGLLLAAVLNATLSADLMASFGWRIPFFVGALLGLYALYMRSGMEESEVFETAVGERPAREPIWPQMFRHRRAALQVVGLTLGITVAYYTWAVSAPIYATTTLGIDRGQALWAGVIGSLTFMVALPLWGALSDRIGRKPVLLVGTLGTALLYLPMSYLVKDSMWQLAIAICVMLICLAAFLSIGPAVYAELFPTSVRTTGVGVPYSICIALFGGTAPYLQTWMGATFPDASPFPFYAVALLVISGLTVLKLPETKARDLHRL